MQTVRKSECSFIVIININKLNCPPNDIHTNADRRKFAIVEKIGESVPEIEEP